MALPAEKPEAGKPESKVVKISSKRQITIPAEWYREAGFADYALVTRTDEGLVFQPLDVESEDASVKILGRLIAEGYEGDELLAKYKDANDKLKSIKRLMGEAEADIEAGRAVDFDEMTEAADSKHVPGKHHKAGSNTNNA